MKYEPVNLVESALLSTPGLLSQNEPMIKLLIAINLSPTHGILISPTTIYIQKQKISNNYIYFHKKYSNYEKYSNGYICLYTEYIS